MICLMYHSTKSQTDIYSCGLLECVEKTSHGVFDRMMMKVCGFTSFSTLFQSHQDGCSMIIKDSVYSVNYNLGSDISPVPL